MKKKYKVQSNDQFSSQRRGVIQPRYMNPKSLLSYKQKSSQDLFQQTKALEEKDFYKKYYGNKVLYVSDNKKSIISAINFSKLFRSIALSPMLFFSGYFKALGNMVIMGENLRLMKKQHRKLIKRSKGKIRFNLDHRSSKSMRDLYGLRGFRALELFLTKKEQLSEFSPGILKEFSRLEKIRIQFHEFHLDRQKTIFLEEQSLIDTFDFLLKMIKNSKTLKIFQCDLAPFYMEPKFLRKLLLYLDNYDVKSWYIAARISFEEFLEITQTNSRLKKFQKEEAKDFQQVFETVDLLGLHNSENIDKDLVEICQRQDQFRHLFQFLSETPSMLCKHNRILDINERYVGVKKSKNSIDLGHLLKKFESLRGLYIQIIQGDLMLRDKNQIESLCHLRNIIFSEVGYSLFGDNKEPIAESLLEVLSKSSPKLKRMQIYSDSFKLMGDRNFGFLIKRNMEIYDKHLKEFESLRELEINLDNGFPNGFEKVVKRLRVLRVNFENFQKKKKYDLEIAPFVGNHLKELHLTIKPKQQEIIWIDKIAWNVDRFPDLEVLIVDDQNENRIKLEQFCKFMKAVNKFKNLKRLVVKMKLEESRNDDYSDLLSQEVIKTIRLLEDEMIESILKDTRTLIESHPNLEEIDIKGFCGHRIERIFYQKTTIKRKEKTFKSFFGGGGEWGKFK